MQISTPHELEKYGVLKLLTKPATRLRNIQRGAGHFGRPFGSLYLHFANPDYLQATDGTEKRAVNSRVFLGQLSCGYFKRNERRYCKI